METNLSRDMLRREVLSVFSRRRLEGPVYGDSTGQHQNPLGLLCDYSPTYNERLDGFVLSTLQWREGQSRQWRD